MTRATLLTLTLNHPPLPTMPTAPLMATPSPGDVVYAYSRARYRVGLVATVGPRWITVEYTTRTAIDRARRDWPTQWRDKFHVTTVRLPRTPPVGADPRALLYAAT